MTYSDIMSLANKIDQRKGYYLEFLIQLPNGEFSTRTAFDYSTAKAIALQWEGRIYRTTLKCKRR